MNNIALNEVPMAVYQLLRQYGQAQLEDFHVLLNRIMTHTSLGT